MLTPGPRQSEHLIEPAVADEDGTPVGMALTPRVGEVDKTYLVARAGQLAADSVESLDLALRAALDL